jgi:cobalt-zinc-cadmium efflux system membrane fusion protein
MAARKELLEAELEVDAARAEIASATAALGLIDVEPGSASTYALLAPIDGLVVRLPAVAGRMVDAEETLCEVVDTSSMWAELDVPELELGQVVAGLSVHLSIESLGERELEGKIDYVAPEIDPRTRTVKARVRLDNAAGLLRAGMYANAIVTLGPSRARVMVPIDALQRAGKFHLVFVRVADNTYETRRVKLGARCAHDVEILQGIEPGERVAARGSFLLKTETLRGSIGAGCCEVD